MYLLLVITLNFGTIDRPQPFVEDVQLLGIRATEKKCQAYADEIKAKAKKRGTPIPVNKEIGCLSLNAKKT